MSTLTTTQYMLNNGISNEDSDGDTILRCLKYTSKRVDDAFVQIGLLPPDISTFTAAMAALQVDVNKLKSYTVVNVKDYGAVGNGIVDDTTFINNAIAALNNSGAMLYFPNGIYKVTGKLQISNKTNLLVKFDGVIINSTFDGDCLYFYNCLGTYISGYCSINWVGSGSPSNANAIVIELSYYSIFSNFLIYGQWTNGFKLLTASGVGATNVSATIITNNTIRGCQTGISGNGEYYNICNCHVVQCTSYGIIINGFGNISIDNCSVNNNNVGICVAGITNNNSDHSKITGCIINHNQACGIWLKNLAFSFNVTGNQIWASLGPNTLTLATAVMARDGKFGVYMENVINVNFTGNHVARCYHLMGLDGYCLTNISNNTFMSAIGLTGIHIAEYGNNNTTYGGNAQNIICNNTFEGAITTGWENIYFNDNVTNSSYYIKGNRGTNSQPYKLINSTNFNNFINSSESWVVDANSVGLNTVDTVNGSPDSQVINITVLSHLQGEEFSINFINATKWVWIRFKTNNTTTTMNISGNGIAPHYPSKKAIAINTSICKKVTFVPINNLPNGWVAVSNN